MTDADRWTWRWWLAMAWWLGRVFGGLYLGFAAMITVFFWLICGWSETRLPGNIGTVVISHGLGDGHFFVRDYAAYGRRLLLDENLGEAFMGITLSNVHITSDGQMVWVTICDESHPDVGYDFEWHRRITANELPFAISRHGGEEGRPENQLRGHTRPAMPWDTW